MGTQIIAVANQKGGVGKTTTSVNVSACLATQGRKVLLLDLDPQANATSGLGLEKVVDASSYKALLGEGRLEDKIQSTGVENLEIIPSEVDMCGVEVEISRLDSHLMRLKQALAPLRNSNRYEIILIDCPPSLGILTLNAFAASDWLLVPLQCEYYALEGISMITRLMDQLHQSGTNPHFQLLGIVMTMFDGRTRLSQQVVGEVRQHFAEKVFETVIPRATRLAEAPSYGKPIIQYDPYSVGASAYEVLTQEITDRLQLKGLPR